MKSYVIARSNLCKRDSSHCLVVKEWGRIDTNEGTMTLKVHRLLFSSFVIGDTKDVVCRHVIKFSEKYQFFSANIGDAVFYFAVLLLCGLYHFCDLGLAEVTVFPKISDSVHNEFSFVVFFYYFTLHTAYRQHFIKILQKTIVNLTITRYNIVVNKIIGDNCDNI